MADVSRRRDVAHRAGVLAMAAATFALAAVALAPQQAAAADAPRLIHNYKLQSITCAGGAGGTVFARTSVRMSVVNYDGLADWADHMEAKVRVEPTTTGLNFTRPWKAAKSNYLIQNHRYAYNFNVNSDTVNGAASWRLHFKLIWHRTAPVRNVTVEFYRPFNSSCAPADPGVVLGG